MATDSFWLKTPVTSINQVADYFLLYSASNSAIRPISRNNVLGITGAPVGTTDTQALSAKTLTSPTINSATLSGTLSGTYTLGGTPTFPASVMSLTGVQTATNKTFTSPAINGGTISNPTLNIDSISGFTTPTVVTIGGVQMNNGVINTTGAVTSASIATGAVQPQSLVAGTGTGWSWQSWTPTWTNFTVGNGVVTANYVQIGKTVFLNMAVNFGSTTSMGATSPTFTVPVTAKSRYSSNGRNIVGATEYINTGVTTYPGFAVFDLSTTAIELFAMNASATYLTENVITSTVPFTWTNGSTFTITATYEAA